MAALPSFASRPERSERARVGALRGAEHRREADERAASNLHPDELALWRKIRSQLKGTPHARLEAFRQYVHDHPGELEAARRELGEKRAKALVRARLSDVAKVACAPPFRARVKLQCQGGGLPAFASGKSVEVACAEPYRFRVKDLCTPKGRWSKPKKARSSPPPGPEHAFADLLSW